VPDESADLPPEISTNDEWRLLMSTARKERKWKQSELAEKVARTSKLSCTQALISQIESGAIQSSRLIRPISDMLAIPEPMRFRDDLDKQWWLAGHYMRTKNPDLFRAQLAAMEAMSKALPAQNDEQSSDDVAAEKQPPTRK